MERAMRGFVACFLIVSLSVVAWFATPRAAHAASADIVGPATVRADGSLRIHGSIVRLYGIAVPLSGQKCITYLRPARCGSRAAVALESRIQGFVYCHSVNRNGDGSVNAVCFNRRTFYSLGEDLAAYLLGAGLALALPGAPFEYVALERIAQTRQLGVWGFSADAIISRGRGRY
jgi:endonuclease YncB( thermonuclease family)